MKASHAKWALLAAGLLVCILLLSIIAGAFYTHSLYVSSVVDTGRYLEHCQKTQTRPSLDGVEEALSGMTVRSVSANPDGTSTVVHRWTVFGFIETNKCLYIKVDGDPNSNPNLLKLSRDPL